jgi:death-on-curing protein
MFGGLPGIRDLGLIESAISRPFTGYYRSIERKAAALVQSMSGNHGFVDGNKRTTVILAHTLLERSGYRLERIAVDESLDIAIEEMVLAVVTHKMTFEALVRWFHERIRAR